MSEAKHGFQTLHSTVRSKSIVVQPRVLEGLTSLASKHAKCQVLSSIVPVLKAFKLFHLNNQNNCKL